MGGNGDLGERTSGVATVALGDDLDADVAVVGLGYVGLTLAAVMARAGLRVAGFDANPVARAGVRACEPAFFEPALADELRNWMGDRLMVVDELPDPLPSAVVICVGTPLDPATRAPDLSQLEAAADAIADRLTDYTLVVVRSTVPVGTCRSVVLPRLRRRVSAPLLACCPERTIQGQALAELVALPQIVGGLDELAAVRASGLFSAVAADRVVVSSVEAAEMVKLVNNSHTDVIYGYGNEVALMASALGLDAHEVIAAANLHYPRPDLSRPGFVGGSCLTKDPYLLIHAAAGAGYSPPLVAAARAVNESVPAHAADRVVAALGATGRTLAACKVLVCGVAYKGTPETDDVRGGAAPELVGALGGQVAELAGHDFVVPPGRIAALGLKPQPLSDGLEGADAAVFLVDHPGYRDLTADDIRDRMRPPAVVFDMWGVLDAPLRAAADVVYLRLGRG